MQKFLIVQTAFIGDVVLATVIIEKLHLNFPDAQIDFLLRKGNEGLLKGHPYLHEVLIWDKKTDKQKNLVKMIQLTRQRKYDKVINLQRFFATGLLTALSGAKERIGFDKNPLSFLFDKKVKHAIGTADYYTHETERNLLLVAHFTDNRKVRMKLYPSRTDQDVVLLYKAKSYICIAPSSVWFTKQYPKEKWIAFLQQLPKHFTVYLLGAPSDKNLCDAIIAQVKDVAIINLAGKLSFLESAALMQHATMNYVNDSAPLHFASAMNAPVTAVFCSTVTWFGFGPLSDKSFVAEIQEPLYCRPCGLHGKKECPEKHFKCALEITEAQLLKSIED
jgi:heptosyltransferase-2